MSYVLFTANPNKREAFDGLLQRAKNFGYDVLNPDKTAGTFLIQGRAPEAVMGRMSGYEMGYVKRMQIVDTVQMEAA